MKGTIILSLLSLLCFAQVITGTITPKCLAYRSLPAPSPQPGLVNCPQFRDLSCCDSSVDSLIVPHENRTQLYGFNWDRCGPLSPACQKFFQAESCYFECDPYQAPFATSTDPDPVGFVAVPMCSTYCDSWFEACKNDFTCGDEWMTDFVSVQNEQGETVEYVCGPNSQCRSFSEVYNNGKGLCDNLWGAAFFYSENLTNCVTWDFGLTTNNPNRHVEKSAVADTHCYDNIPVIPKKDNPKVEPKCLAGRENAEPKAEKNLRDCSRFGDLSCCGATVANIITEDISDPAVHWYEWNQCGKLSAACEKFFKAESCYYECDPYLHQWANPTQANADGVVGVPVCADVCDSWYEACKNDMACGDEWLTDFVPKPNNTGFQCSSSSVCKPFTQVFQNSRELCDILWGGHYYYSENTENCVRWEFSGNNPNDQVVKRGYAEEPCPVVESSTGKKSKTAATVLAILFAVTFFVLGTFIALLIIREQNGRPMFGPKKTRVVS